VRQSGIWKNIIKSDRCGIPLSVACCICRRVLRVLHPARSIGPRARPMDPDWVNEIEVMCRNGGIAFFFKQWGGTNKKRTGRLFRGETIDEMPEATA
jgi:protein gp37